MASKTHHFIKIEAILNSIRFCYPAKQIGSKTLAYYTKTKISFLKFNPYLNIINS